MACHYQEFDLCLFLTPSLMLLLSSLFLFHPNCRNLPLGWILADWVLQSGSFSSGFSFHPHFPLYSVPFLSHSFRIFFLFAFSVRWINLILDLIHIFSLHSCSKLQQIWFSFYACCNSSRSLDCSTFFRAVEIWLSFFFSFPFVAFSSACNFRYRLHVAGKNGRHSLYCSCCPSSHWLMMLFWPFPSFPLRQLFLAVL